MKPELGGLLTAFVILMASGSPLAETARAIALAAGIVLGIRFAVHGLWEFLR